MPTAALAKHRKSTPLQIQRNACQTGGWYSEGQVQQSILKPTRKRGENVKNSTKARCKQRSCNLSPQHREMERERQPSGPSTPAPDWTTAVPPERERSELQEPSKGRRARPQRRKHGAMPHGPPLPPLDPHLAFPPTGRLTSQPTSPRQKGSTAEHPQSAMLCWNATTTVIRNSSPVLALTATARLRKDFGERFRAPDPCG